MKTDFGSTCMLEKNKNKLKEVNLFGKHDPTAVERSQVVGAVNKLKSRQHECWQQSTGHS